METIIHIVIALDLILAGIEFIIINKEIQNLKKEETKMSLKLNSVYKDVCANELNKAVNDALVERIDNLEKFVDFLSEVISGTFVTWPYHEGNGEFSFKMVPAKVLIDLYKEGWPKESAIVDEYLEGCTLGLDEDLENLVRKEYQKQPKTENTPKKQQKRTYRKIEEFNKHKYILTKGDKVIAKGTIAEISKQTGKSPERLRTYNTPTYLSKAGKNSLKLLKTK